MLDDALIAFTTFFVTIGPVEAAVLFAALTPDNTALQRRGIALRGTLIATGILLVFALFGDILLQRLGITLPALRTAGGILLLLMAIDMVFARPSGGTSTTSAEAEEAQHKPDISVFPLATPLIAGPGAMGAAVLLFAEAQGDVREQATVVAALLVTLAITLILLLIAARLQKLLGVTGLKVITRVMGVLLAALAVQFIFDGVGASGILGSVVSEQ